MIPESVIISIIGGVVAVVALIARLLYASKCKTVDCLFCKFERDVQNEQSIRNIQL
jgi:hypothetical protein